MIHDKKERERERESLSIRRGTIDRPESTTEHLQLPPQPFNLLLFQQVPSDD